jgi:prepilin peptidase CpaA
MEVWFLAAALFLAAAGAAFDVFTGRIPNQLTYGGIIIGMVFWYAMAGWRGLGMAVLGTLVGGGIFLLFYVVRAMGAGDVKLMAAVGSIAGPRKSIETVFACAIAGGLMAIGYMLYHHRIRGTLANVGELLQFHVRHGAKSHPEINLSNPTAIRMPYGVAIATGCLYSFCMTLLKR